VEAKFARRPPELRGLTFRVAPVRALTPERPRVSIGIPLPADISEFRQLSEAAYGELQGALGVAPLTVIPLHCVRRGAARVLVQGSVAAPRAVVIRRDDLPDELSAHGHDIPAIWSLLQTHARYKCVEVDGAIAPALRELMASRFPAVDLYADVYYALGDAGALGEPACPEIVTRLLTERDVALLDRAPRRLWLNGFGSNAAGLRESIAAGAIVEGEIVAVAEAGAYTGRYADVGVHTLDGFRGLGLATRAAWLVMRELVARGLSPLWSTGEDNHASRRVARKLGLVEVFRSVFLVVEPR
jgi:hypothetical protein